MQATLVDHSAMPTYKYANEVRTHTGVPVGGPGAGLVIVSCRGRGVKGQEEEQRSHQKHFLGGLHVGALHQRGQPGRRAAG